MCLVPEAETNFKVKVLVFRPGVFDLGQLIKYVISNRGNNSELRHSEYENVYLVVKNNEGVSTKTKLLTHDLI